MIEKMTAENIAKTLAKYNVPPPWGSMVIAEALREAFVEGYLKGVGYERLREKEVDDD